MEPKLTRRLQRVVLTSAHGNQYLYSPVFRLLTPAHPALARLALREEPPDSSRHGDRLRWLQESRYFDDDSFEQDILTEEQILDSLTRVNTLVLELTEDCNLDCAYCSYGRYYAPVRGEGPRRRLTPEAAREAMEFFMGSSDAPSFDINFYGGEPLLEFPLIEQVILEARREHPDRDVSFNMTTNGVLLGKHMDFLAEHEVELLVSLDGGREHNAFRVFPNQRESFPEVFDNLKALRRRHPRYFDERVSLFSVLTRANPQQELKQFFLDAFAKEPEFEDVSPHGLRAELADEFHRRFVVEERIGADPDELLSWRFETFAKLSSSGQQRAVGAKKFLSTACCPFEVKVFVRADGKILSCERVHPDLEVGRWDERGVHLNLARTVENYNAIMKRCNRICETCYVLGCAACILAKFRSGIEDGSCEDYLGLDEVSRTLTAAVDSLEARVHQPPDPPHAWLYLEAHAEVTLTSGEALVYNTLDGAHDVFGQSEAVDLISRMSDRAVGLSEASLDRPGTEHLVDRLRTLHLGELVPARGPVAPIRRSGKLQVVNLAAEPKAGDHSLVLKQPTVEIRSLAFYVNETSSDDGIDDAFRQFPTVRPGRGGKTLEPAAVQRVLVATSRASSNPISVSFLGGDLFAYSPLGQLVELAAGAGYRLSLYFTCQQVASANPSRMRELFSTLPLDSQIHVATGFPADDRMLASCSSRLGEIPHPRVFDLILREEADYDAAAEAIDTHGLRPFAPRLFYNGHNAGFIEEHAFITEAQIRQTRLTQLELRTRRRLNPLSFGTLHLLPEGEVYANLHGARLGSISDGELDDLVRQELASGDSWLLTRERIEPCSGCLYRTLCPPVSGLERAMGQYRICTFGPR